MRPERERLAARTADVLLARIHGGEWELGSRLPGETTLAAQLEVGRSTVREAVRELAGRGVLATRQGAGVFVLALDAAESWDDVLTRADARAVIEARVAVESEAARLAAVRRTGAELKELRRRLRGREQAGASVEQLVDADLAFHRAVMVAAHNPVLLQLFDAFVPRVRGTMVDVLRIRPLPSLEDDHDHHAELVAAIDACDPDRAARSSRVHLTSLSEVFG